MNSPTDLGYRLQRLVGRLNRYANHHTTFPVPWAQLRLLALIGDLEPVRVGVLAAADHSSQPTVTSQLNRTDRAGWTTRSPDPNDARALVVRLTDEGRRQLAEVRAQRAQATAPVIAAWSAERQRRLADALELLDELMAELSDSDPGNREGVITAQTSDKRPNDRRES